VFGRNHVRAYRTRVAIAVAVRDEFAAVDLQSHVVAGLALHQDVSAGATKLDDRDGIAFGESAPVEIVLARGARTYAKPGDQLVDT
jgi:hypothetical protein